MSVTITEVVSRRDKEAFVRLPHALYRENPYWVPSMDADEHHTFDPRKNPAFEFCTAKRWLAYKDGALAGRIAGIINRRYIETWKHRYARFGWADFVDDAEVSAALFGTVEAWARENGMEGIQGPLGFSDFDHQGMLVEGFDVLAELSGVYNFPYYPEHLKNQAYVKETDWLEFRITLTGDAYDKIGRMAQIVEKRFNLHAVPMRTKKDVMQRVPDVFRLINDCYKDLFGFVQFTDAQVEYYRAAYFSFIRPSFVQIIEDADHRLAGFGLTLPSLSLALRRAGGRLLPFGFLHLLRALYHNDTAELLLVAIRPDLQGKGVNAMIMREGYKTFADNNITIVDASGQLETNTKVLSLWQHFQAHQNKRKRCFFKSLA